MSTIQEKLEHFNEVILKDATSERDRILQNMKAEAEKRIDLEKRKFQEQADRFLKKEISLAENEKNNIISRAILEGRQLLMNTREGIINSVFSEVRQILEEFAGSNEYLSYLSASIRKSCIQAGSGELTVYISKRDMEKLSGKLENIKIELPPSTEFQEINDEVIGGCQVLNKTKNILINNTLIEKLEANREKFFEVCGLKID